MYKLKWTRLQAEIFRLLCIKAGQTWNARQIAKSLLVSPTAVSSAVKELQREELIQVKKSKTMNLLSITFNRDNYKAIQLKRVENLRLLYESGCADVLYHEFPGCTIVLFGSYSLGEDVMFGEKDERNSDLDIAIIGTKGKKIEKIKYSQLLEREISIHFYSSWNSIHKHLKENIFGGIVINGGIEI